MPSGHPDRRTAIRHGLAASASFLVAPDALLALLQPPRPGAERPWLAVAQKADQWLRLGRQRGPRGSAWPADPANPGAVSTDLYTGMAGVVLFYLELHRATGDAEALSAAREGADYLLASVPDEPAASTAMGLYTGLAGTAIVLQHAHELAGDSRYRDGVGRVLSLLERSAGPAGAGVEWNESTDIISGSAGIGLALLQLAPAFRNVDGVALARRAADRLIERAQRTDNGLSWLISPQMPRNYPNFSHGTAGVSYFLARLGAATGQASYLEAALAGERWLHSIATATPNDGRMVYHSAPGNEQLYYLSWCHGPAGTARLYRALARASGDARWDRAVEQCARAIEHMKVPQRSPGFWNNVSQCCGNAGVIEFFLALHRQTRNELHLAFAEEVGHDTLRRAAAEGDGLKWVQAEHRVRPELLVAQTGLMQGAAGIGLAMLHLDGAREGRTPFVRLPDDPWHQA